MKNIVKLFLLLLVFLSCEENKNKLELTGNWKTIGIEDNTGLNISDKIEFKKNGEYNLTILSNNDSIINTFKGTFKYDGEKLILNINNREFINEILSFDNKRVKIKNPEGQIYELKKIE